MASSQQDIVKHLSETVQPHQMSFQRVSWEDCARGLNAGGGLSCVGPNITDVRLKQMDGNPVYVLRTENWNELVAFVSAKQLAVVVGQENAESKDKTMESITLEKYLSEVGRYAHYAGPPDASTSLLSPKLDRTIGVRIQGVFVAEDSNITANVYSYGTYSSDNPQNALIYCTTQGTSFQTPKSGATDLFLLTPMPGGTTRASWLKTAKSEFDVGAAQTETPETIAKATAAGHAVAMKIGVKELGDACNTVLLIQVPLEQRPRVRDTPEDGWDKYKGSSGSKKSTHPYFGTSLLPLGEESSNVHAGMVQSIEQVMIRGVPLDDLIDKSVPLSAKYKGGMYESAKRLLRRASPSVSEPVEAKCKAARVSMGTTHTETWTPTKHSNWTRHPKHHITVTITRYWTVKQGCVPTREDALAAVKEIKDLYNALGNAGRLADKGVHMGVVDPAAPSYVYSTSTPFASP